MAVLNDFEACGYGVPALQPEDLLVLNDVPARQKVSPHLHSLYHKGQRKDYATCSVASCKGGPMSGNSADSQLTKGQPVQCLVAALTLAHPSSCSIFLFRGWSLPHSQCTASSRSILLFQGWSLPHSQSTASSCKKSPKVQSLLCWAHPSPTTGESTAAPASHRAQHCQKANMCEILGSSVLNNVPGQHQQKTPAPHNILTLCTLHSQNC